MQQRRKFSEESKREAIELNRSAVRLDENAVAKLRQRSRGPRHRGRE